MSTRSVGDGQQLTLVTALFKFYGNAGDNC